MTRLEKVINEIDSIRMDAGFEEYVDTLTLVMLILKDYDNSAFIEEPEMRDKFKRILDEFYS